MHYCISCVSKSQLNRHQRIQDALACVVIAAPISPIHSRVSELAQDTLWYRNVLNAKLFPPHRSSSSLFSHVTWTIPSQYSFLDPLDHLHWSLSSKQHFMPVLKSQTALFGMLHLTCGRSYLLLFVFLWNHDQILCAYDCFLKLLLINTTFYIVCCIRLQFVSCSINQWLIDWLIDCSLSVWCIIITQLFSIVRLLSWIDCLHISWRFPLSS